MRAMACMFCWCRKWTNLGTSCNVDLVLAEQRVIEGDVDAAVGVFDIEDDGVAADFAPMLDDAEAVIAGGHDAGQVDGADFEILGDGDRFLGDGRGENSGNDDVFVGLEDVGRVGFVVHGANGVGQFGGSQIRSPAKIVAGDGRGWLRRAWRCRVRCRERLQAWVTGIVRQPCRSALCAGQDALTACNCCASDATAGLRGLRLALKSEESASPTRHAAAAKNNSRNSGDDADRRKTQAFLRKSYQMRS